MSKFKPFLALEASAGSGKTFALSVRFVALILQGAKINEILALTFTKKAANEMQKRVIDTFLYLEQDSKNAECKALCELLDFSKDELIALRDQKKQDFLRQNLKISTFDAFFSRILRSFSLNLGLMSDFEISEEELDVKAVFLKILSTKELRDLAYYICEFDEKEAFFKELERLYENAYFKDNLKISFCDKTKLNEAYRDLRSYALGLNHKNLSANFDNEELELNEFLEKPFMSKFESTKYLRDLYNEDAIFSKKRDEFLKILNVYANELEEFKIAKLMNLLEHFGEAKNIIHKNKNILSFSDVSKKVLDLMQSDLKDMIYFRLDGNISHLLIDEFQDTSVIQYQILLPIISELVSGEGVKKNRSFFYVGDKKQSIYRFRKGKKELFDLLQKDFVQIQKENLDTNYRSQKILVDFVNEIFENKFQNYIAQKTPNDESKKGGFVRVIQSNEEKKPKEEQSREIKEKTLETLLGQIRFLQSKNIALEKICILCWKNDDADLVLEFLHQNGISAFTQSNVLLENKASVKAVLEYAKFCIFGDEFYGVFLKELLGEEFPRLELDLSKSAMKNVLYLAKKLKLNLSDIALIQFIEYAGSKNNFLELLFEPCNLKILNEQNWGISIMSVHKSKGLEFDHVILLDSLSKPQNNTDKILLEYDISMGWELKIRDKIRKNTQDEKYNAFLESIQKAELEDEINKLYVAMTRAKKSLIIIKRNEALVNGSYLSYFSSDRYLNLACEERGEIIAEEKLDTNSNEKQQALLEFVKVGLQEVEDKQYLNSFEIYFGNAFHFFMQNLKLPYGENFETLCEKTKGKFRHFLSKEDFTRLFKRIKMLLQNDDFSKLIANKQLLKEQDFSFNGEIKRVDLLALDEKSACVLDYKTSLLMQTKHIEQVKFYKDSLREILKKETSAFLVYCLEDEIKIQEV
ncbi:RecB-like helicase [Campylobacter sp. CCS1377]|uniref:DNA 3'-5' helicase n=1 Tax=Campylobacter sp. CCS1377 TaxID=3158229 RepID=A0AAU7E7R7_9BACT